MAEQAELGEMIGMADTDKMADIDKTAEIDKIDKNDKMGKMDKTNKLFLIRYSEIALKSPPVRRRWEDVLVSNIQKALPGCRVRKSWGRIWWKINHQEVIRLRRVSACLSEAEHCPLMI
jgi:hypothetical protein